MSTRDRQRDEGPEGGHRGRRRRAAAFVLALAVAAAACAGGGDEQAVVDGGGGSGADGREAFCDAAQATADANDASADAELPSDVEAAIGDLQAALDELLLQAPGSIRGDLVTIKSFTDAAADELEGAAYDQDEVDFTALDGAEEIDGAVSAIDEVTEDECDVAASGTDGAEDDPTIGPGGEEPATTVGAADQEAAVITATEEALGDYAVAASDADIDAVGEVAEGAFLLNAGHNLLVAAVTGRGALALEVEADLTGATDEGGDRWTVEGEITFTQDGATSDVESVTVDYDGDRATLVDSTTDDPPLSERLLLEPGRTATSEGFTTALASAKLVPGADPGLEVVIQFTGDPPFVKAEIPGGAAISYVDSSGAGGDTTEWVTNGPPDLPELTLVVFVPGTPARVGDGVDLYVPFSGAGGESAAVAVSVPAVGR